MLKKRIWGILAVGTALAVLAAGCGGEKTAQAPGPVPVKAMQVIQKDTPIEYEFVGQVDAKDEVKVQSKVSGTIVAKLVSGGTVVTKGQPLFQIDRRQYEAALMDKKAQLAQSAAALAKVRTDVSRNRMLAAQQAISQQTLDNSLSEEEQNAALVRANQAQVDQAKLDLQDTLIVSTMNGRIDVNDLSVGNYALAGQTVLATISSVDPVMVSFAVSENEYLSLVKQYGDENDLNNQSLKLILADGSVYPLRGSVKQVDRSLSKDTGTLTLKAEFANPEHLLVPGMFARVVATGEIRKGALLVPQRAVQEMLGKYFVTVVGADQKTETRAVEMGPKSGDLWLVDAGLKPGETVVVEGFLKTPPGTPVQITAITPEDLKIPATQQ